MPPKGKAKAVDADDDNGGGSKKGGSGAKVKVRHILCEKQGQILKAQAAIKGADGNPPRRFQDVAMEMSIDKARSGGDLGWQARGQMVGAFQDVAFAQPIGVPSEPFKTQFGWHIVLVEDRK